MANNKPLSIQEKIKAHEKDADFKNKLRIAKMRTYRLEADNVHSDEL